MELGRNIYRLDDGVGEMPSGPKVFISHRSVDKPIARAIAGLLSALGVHYWLDENDQDLQRAAALGMLGEVGVVHAIERGVKHTTALLALVSSRTVGSWWVPYEIGFSRSAGKSSSFVVIGTPGQVALPSYSQVAATYSSVDELARWASSLTGHDLHADVTGLPPASIDELARYLPLDPALPDAAALCDQALDAIAILATSAAQQALTLTSGSFDWLPTDGGAVADIGYDLLAPLAYVRLHSADDPDVRKLMQMAYSAPARHYDIAAESPRLEYVPECDGWKAQRYRTPERTWLQGLTATQLDERLDRFLTAKDRQGRQRMATRDEFKAEFYRVLRSGDEGSRRSLGVMLNPLFGFTPRLRPVLWRILSIQGLLYAQITGRQLDALFEDDLRRLAQGYVERTRHDDFQ